MRQENFIKRCDALNICNRSDLHEVVNTAVVVLLTLTIGTSKQPAQIYTDTPAAVLAQIEQAGETVTAYTIE